MVDRIDLHLRGELLNLFQGEVHILYLVRQRRDLHLLWRKLLNLLRRKVGEMPVDLHLLNLLRGKVSGESCLPHALLLDKRESTVEGVDEQMTTSSPVEVHRHFPHFPPKEVEQLPPEEVEVSPLSDEVEKVYFPLKEVERGREDVCPPSSSQEEVNKMNSEKVEDLKILPYLEILLHVAEVTKEKNAYTTARIIHKKPDTMIALNQWEGVSSHALSVTKNPKIVAAKVAALANRRNKLKRRREGGVEREKREAREESAAAKERKEAVEFCSFALVPHGMEGEKG
ncbi:hypothetical protein ACLOJK_002104 [Asimina triloba]